MNFALQLQLLGALPFLRRVQLGLPFVGLAAFAQRGNPVTERLPVDPGPVGRFLRETTLRRNET